MRNYSSTLIVLVTCLIVLGPVLSEFGGPRSQSRWILAFAANEFYDGNPESAAKQLQRALEVSPEIIVDPEFWKLRFELAFSKDATPSFESQSELCDEAIRLIRSLPPELRMEAAQEVSKQFQKNKNIELAFHVLEEVLPPISQRSPMDNNNLAYLRALIQTDLDIAIQEIDTALKTTVDPSFLDTKAWVLYGLGRHDSALKFIEASIDRAYKALREQISDRNKQDAFVAWFEPDGPSKRQESSNSSENDAPSGNDLPSIRSLSDIADRLEAHEKSSDTNLRKKLEDFKKNFSWINLQALQSRLHTIAIMRYHRAHILIELERYEEATRDIDWLIRFGFTRLEELET